jgi:hypothetical protein
MKTDLFVYLHFSKTLLKKIIKDAEKLIEKMNKKNEAIRQKISKSLRTSQEHTAHPLVYHLSNHCILVILTVFRHFFVTLVFDTVIYADRNLCRSEKFDFGSTVCYILCWTSCSSSFLHRIPTVRKFG